MLAAALPLGGVLAALAMLPSPGAPHTDTPPNGEHAARSATAPAGPRSRLPAGLRSYAVPAPEISGLAPDALPGTRMELWVAWEPPVTKGPRVQRLVDEAVLEAIAPPTVPAAPPTAVLLVADEAVPDLIYGDLYGRLSAVKLPD